MRRCSSCGTRLSPEAFRCWLCHAAAPALAENAEPDTLPIVVPKDHVVGGPLARTSQHGDPDPIAASILGGRRSEGTPLGHRVSAYVLHVLGRRQRVT
jgi:hypothetical protein